MKFIFLADKPETLPTVAQWFLNEWGHLNPEATLERNQSKLSEYLNRDKLPLMIYAVEGDEILGCSYLCYHEMSIYTDKEHWVGGVYVEKAHRGKKVASQMVGELERLAKDLGIEKLHLQTEQLDGGLYGRIGFEEIEQVEYRGVKVSVRVKSL
ncbi:GNAT family N-acetyltransferase [Grimontia kaedaensis]|uniref:GNAT family N-acetyltransferase n=1 Tax=Grimontia kaedaensis TaxID=2872157 RepID=A0ABY4WN44_9GAMM|nr:GNAT family N-acetyltransferase [Grimontia kaedaensis]USH01006.1 GNAT family N-acetyltransferase [Grimontia kaedaensis]